MATGISRMIFATIFEDIFGIIRRMYKRVMNYPVYISLTNTGIPQVLYKTLNAYHFSTEAKTQD